MGGHGDAGGDDRGRARRGEQAEEPALEAEAREGRLREHGGDADPGDRRGQAYAERDDQDEAVREPVQRDGGEQDDECGRAGQEAARDADGEQRAGAQFGLLRVVMTMGVGVGAPVPPARA